MDYPRVFSINTDIDVNSGDTRLRMYICFLQIKHEIQTTPFSQEVRRLAIDVRQERKWMPTHTTLLSYRRIDYVYGGTPGQCKFLIKIFNDGNVPDEERRVIIERILTILQSGDRRAAAMVEDEVQALAERVYKKPRQNRQAGPSAG
jgi:hypothetical protein